MDFEAEEAYESIYVVTTNESVGSGFAIGENSILTNAHVVGESTSVTLLTYGNQSINANVHLLSYEMDIALLVVEAPVMIPLKPVSIENVSIGDEIYTVGAPNSMVYTLTKGIISAKNRLIGGISYIQVDAPINSGNSGGPLLNSSGEVLGINTLKLSDSEGIGLAIPIYDTIELLEENGIIFNEDGNIEGLLPYSANNEPMIPREHNETNNDQKDFATEQELGNNKDWLFFALAFSILLNVILISYILIKRKPKQYVDPSERTDFEINIEE